MKYKVDYYYMAQGMDKAEEVDHGVVEANSKEEAREIVALKEVPEDSMYGPNNSWSVRDWVKGCLSAKIMLDGEHVTTKEEWRNILEQIVNGEWVRVDPEGKLKYRSGMDAGAPPPPWFFMNLSEIIHECRYGR